VRAAAGRRRHEPQTFDTLSVSKIVGTAAKGSGDKKGLCPGNMPIMPA